jgi:hypothetical protein
VGSDGNGGAAGVEDLGDLGALERLAGDVDVAARARPVPVADSLSRFHALVATLARSLSPIVSHSATGTSGAVREQLAR